MAKIIQSLLAAGILATASLSVVSCGILTSGDYLASYGNGAALIQITINEDYASGTINVTADLGTSIQTDQSSFTGHINGSNITLNFVQGLGSYSSVSGTESGGEITLNLPQPNGSLAATTFVASSATAYNAAVSKLNQAANKELKLQQQEEQQQEQQQAAAQQLEQEQNSIVNSSNQVQTDINNLSSEDVFNLSQFQSDLQTQQNDLASMRSEETTAAAESDTYTACSDAYAVQSDAYTVQSDAYTIQSDVYTVNSQVTEVENDIANLKQDTMTLQNAEAVLPEYMPTGLVSQDTVNAAISSATANYLQAQSTANADLTKANAVSSSAQTEAQSIVSQYCN